MKKNRTETISKGYRLKPETHELIKKIQKQLKVSRDRVISEALKHYSKKIELLN